MNKGTNAVHLTLYHPEGRTISSAVQKEAEQAIEKLAQEHGLLVSVAKA